MSFVVWHVPKGNPSHCGDEHSRQECDTIMICDGDDKAPSATLSPAWYKCSGREAAKFGTHVPRGVLSRSVWKPNKVKIDRIIQECRLGVFESANDALSFARSHSSMRNWKLDEKIYGLTT